MSELVPTVPGGNRSEPLARLRDMAGQPAVRRVLPWFLGIAAIGGVALVWSALAPSAQRTLYAELGDAERATVSAALDKAAIGYAIDGTTGAVTVDEGDFYRARMLVASDGAVATPESGDQMLDRLPMGASRTLEGQRLRAARERDLQLTIMEIDGVESVRVHLAEGEKSVFVRENLPPSASVMLRLARGRQLSDSQVSAIVNLVAGSVPGLSADAVRVVDQHGRLVSAQSGKDSDRLELQGRIEEKLRNQLAALLTPMLGEGNFTSEIQVELDMDEVTSARESYDKQGVVRSETMAASQASGSGQGIGVPGVLSNTPPPAATASPGPPQPAASQPAAPGQAAGESSTQRTYELGREVSVANAAPGKLRRLSVAVALSAAAMKGTKPADLDQITKLVSAAVGADPQRGDQVAVMTRKFEPVTDEAVPIYETGWFATLVRSIVALLAVLLVLLIGVRPLVKALRRDPASTAPLPEESEDGSAIARELPNALAPSPLPDPDVLNEQVGLAQRLVSEKPDSAVAALRQMLAQPGELAR